MFEISHYRDGDSKQGRGHFAGRELGCLLHFGRAVKSNPSVDWAVHDHQRKQT